MTKQTFTRLLTAVLACSVSFQIHAQDVVPPKPLQQDPPAAPARANREALVHLRYTVKADGSTADVEVMDGFTNSRFNDAAVKAVEAWTFSPATSAGEAIDFLNQEHVLSFVRGEQSTISSQIRRAADQILQQMQDKQYGDAASRLEKLLKGNVSTVFDYIFLNDLLSSAYIGLNQPYEALAASKRATMQSGAVGAEEARDLLPQELLVPALRKRFILALSLSQNVDAYQTYQRLVSLSALSDDDPVHEQAKAIKAKLDSPEPLGQLVKITDKASWSYTPLRRTLTVTDVSNGKIGYLDVRCQRRSIHLEFQEDVQWNLPEVFGACSLEFKGDNGTQFTLYEYSE